MQDVIKREITINAAREAVYDAIANPDAVTKWFPDAIEGTYAVGERPVFVFNGHGKSQIFVTDAKPYEYFAFRWIPGGSDFLGDVTTVPNTLVEFVIEQAGDDVCKVIVTETGFAALPDEMAEKTYGMNSSGWDFMIGRLAKHFSQE